MEKTNLQRVLRTLTKQEWRSLGDFIASPYFNKNEKFVKFYSRLSPYYGLFEISEPQKIKIYRQVTKSAEFNDPSYRNLCSDFLELVQTFLAWEYMSKENTIRQQFLTKALLDKQINDLAEKNIVKTEKEILKPGQFDTLEKLRSLIWINDSAILLSILNNRTRINASNEAMKNDTTYRLVTEWALVKIFNSFLNYIKACNNSGSIIDEKRIRLFLEMYDDLKPFEEVITEIYYLMVKMIIDNDSEVYFNARKLFNKNKNTIHIKNHENILIGLLDYVNNNLHRDESWRQELFELSVIKLNDKLWKENKGLSYTTLFNAFMNALHMDKLAYAEKMIKQNLQYIHPSVRASMEHLCRAWLLFHQGDLDKAHESLTKVETENILIKYELRTLQCLLYFEKNEWEVLISYLESFRHFILYNKANLDKKVTALFSEFTKYLTALVKIQFHPAKKDATALREQIENAGQVYLKPWFLSKLGA